MCGYYSSITIFEHDDKFVVVWTWDSPPIDSIDAWIQESENEELRNIRTEFIDRVKKNEIDPTESEQLGEGDLSETSVVLLKSDFNEFRFMKELYDIKKEYSRGLLTSRLVISRCA